MERKNDEAQRLAFRSRQRNKQMRAQIQHAQKMRLIAKISLGTAICLAVGVAFFLYLWYVGKLGKHSRVIDPDNDERVGNELLAMHGKDPSTDKPLSLDGMIKNHGAVIGADSTAADLQNDPHAWLTGSTLFAGAGGQARSCVNPSLVQKKDPKTGVVYWGTAFSDASNCQGVVPTSASAASQQGKNCKAGCLTSSLCRCDPTSGDPDCSGAGFSKACVAACQQSCDVGTGSEVALSTIGGSKRPAFVSQDVWNAMQACQETIVANSSESPYVLNSNYCWNACMIDYKSGQCTNPVPMSDALIPACVAAINKLGTPDASGPSAHAACAFACLADPDASKQLGAGGSCCQTGQCAGVSVPTDVGGGVFKFQ